MAGRAERASGEASSGQSTKLASLSGSDTLTLRQHGAPRHVPTRVARGALEPPAVVVEVSVGASHTLARRADGAVVSWGHNWMGQLGIGGGEPRFARTPQVVELSGR